MKIRSLFSYRSHAAAPLVELAFCLIILVVSGVLLLKIFIGADELQQSASDLTRAAQHLQSFSEEVFSEDGRSLYPMLWEQGTQTFFYDAALQPGDEAFYQMQAALSGEKTAAGVLYRLSLSFARIGKNGETEEILSGWKASRYMPDVKGGATP